MAVDKQKCPSCGRTIGMLAAGVVRRHNDLDGRLCAGGKPKRSRAARDTSPGSRRDTSNVVDIGAPRAKRPRKAAGMSPEEKATSNAARPPSKALDRAGLGSCGSRTVNKDGRPTGRCAHAKGYGTDHPGFGHCRIHGGKTPNGAKFAALERARHELAQFKASMSFYGHRVAVDPEQALLEEMQRTVGAVRFIEAMLATWGQDERLHAQMVALDPDADQAQIDAARATLKRLTGKSGVGVGVGAVDDGLYVELVGDLDVTHEHGQTGLPTLVGVHTTDKAVGFTDTEYAAWLKVGQAERRHLVLTAKACIDGNIAERRQAVLEARADMMRGLMKHAFVLAGLALTEERALEIVAEATRLTLLELPA